ncbi:hypothetical protein DQ244_06690 [Blastococcus sp. TBT05-19]|uniref:AMIN-like domain-containing (lipo)protein n=1 Tax=Blastococcus sp. TBT05-19 TaxID=2250581 RepID=UPI000DE9EA22|nr:hypothetical protein [Blastococcus sp. TBT05-19]RBY92005.1 hypothetical protein DQ244_06690 [Blastococcus sp. TBT05-19]
MRVPLRLAVPVLAVSLALVSGCAQKGGSDTASSSGTASSSEGETAGETPAAGSSAPASATPAEPFPGDVEPDTETPSGDAQLTVSAVRVAAQDGFDRVVFELGGTGTPGWDVRYVTDPTEPGRGEPVQLEGGAALQVGITGAGYPYDTGVEEFSSPGTLTAAGTAAVTEVDFLATYEGTTTAFVGTRTEAPFRVYLLQDPLRVVVEVAHAG